MGLNSGLVYQHLDINTNLNVQGGGINEAQRIMDAGDAGHILASKETAGMLEHLKRWAPHLDDLGEHVVKHGKRSISTTSTPASSEIQRSRPSSARNGIERGAENSAGWESPRLCWPRSPSRDLCCIKSIRRSSENNMWP